MKTRAAKWFLIGTGLLLSPLFLVVWIILLNTVNPMAMVFLADFEVTNESSETIRVTPSGAVGSEGRRATLPLSVSSRFYLIWPVAKRF